MFFSNQEIAERQLNSLPICDFCARQPPTVKFPQKRGFVMRVAGIDNVFADPWAACTECAPLVERKQMHLLLDRVVALSPRFEGMSRAQKRESRQYLKRLYKAMYTAGVEKSYPIANSETIEAPVESAPKPAGGVTEEHGKAEIATVGDLIAILKTLPSQRQLWVSMPSSPMRVLALANRANLAINADPESDIIPGEYAMLYLLEDYDSHASESHGSTPESARRIAEVPARTHRSASPAARDTDFATPEP